jgi:hypothetical protein
MNTPTPSCKKKAPRSAGVRKTVKPTYGYGHRSVFAKFTGFGAAQYRTARTTPNGV